MLRNSHKVTPSTALNAAGEKHTFEELQTPPSSHHEGLTML